MLAARLRTAARWGPPILAGCAALILWFLVDRWWPLLPLGYGPRWPWLALPIVPLLAGGRWRQRLPPALATLVIVLWGLLGFRLPIWPAPPPWGDPMPLRVVSFNAAVREAAVEQVLDAAREWDADLVVVVECPVRRAGERPTYRLAAAGELCVWSRLGTAPPEIRAASRDPAVIGWSGTIATVTLPGSGLAPIGVVHLRSVRNELSQFLDLSELLGKADSMEARRSKRIAGSRYAREWFDGLAVRPELVMGDFNLVVESARFRSDWGAWSDAFEAIGFGTGHTWHSRWYGLRIDHVLHDAAWRPTTFRIAPPMGSDHRALLVELERRR